MAFDLSFYLDKFAIVCEGKFGRSYDLGEMEKRLSVHRDGTNSVKGIMWAVPLVQDLFDLVLATVKSKTDRPIVRLPTEVTIDF